MKTLRSLLTWMFAVALAGSVAFAAQGPAGKRSAPKNETPAACGCAVDKDAKVCGVDKDCCCTGEKAKGKVEEKKAKAKKAAKADACEACGV